MTADPTFAIACVLFLAFWGAHVYIAGSLRRRVKEQAEALSQVRAKADGAASRERSWQVLVEAATAEVKRLSALPEPTIGGGTLKQWHELAMGLSDDSLERAKRDNDVLLTLMPMLTEDEKKAPWGMDMMPELARRAMARIAALETAPDDLQCLCGAVWSHSHQHGWTLEHLGDRPYGPRWTHAEGGAYVEVGRGKVQFEAGVSGWQPAVLYRSEKDGAWYARREQTFERRFVRVTARQEKPNALNVVTELAGASDSEGGEPA